MIGTLTDPPIVSDVSSAVERVSVEGTEQHTGVATESPPLLLVSQILPSLSMATMILLLTAAIVLVSSRVEGPPMPFHVAPLSSERHTPSVLGEPSTVAAKMPL